MKYFKVYDGNDEDCVNPRAKSAGSATTRAHSALALRQLRQLNPSTPGWRWQRSTLAAKKNRPHRSRSRVFDSQKTLDSDMLTTS
jgi:hypothetical protein